MAEIFAQQTTISCGHINSPLTAYLAGGNPHSDGIDRLIPGRNVMTDHPARRRAAGAGS